MAIVMMPSQQDYLADAPSGYSLYANVRAGSNGDPGGDPEKILGTSSSANAGRFTWDPADSSGGFDAENIPVTITMNLATGADSILLGTTPVPLTFPGPTGGTINHLELTAGTAVNAQVAWSNVHVAFYRSASLQETVSVPGGPSIDTTDSDNPTGEQTATVTPTASNDDEAIITGNITMVCPDYTYPNPEDMFAQAFLFANS
jgi:hypothetical protein